MIVCVVVFAASCRLSVKPGFAARYAVVTVCLRVFYLFPGLPDVVPGRLGQQPCLAEPPKVLCQLIDGILRAVHVIIVAVVLVIDAFRV